MNRPRPRLIAGIMAVIGIFLVVNPLAALPERPFLAISVRVADQGQVYTPISINTRLYRLKNEDFGLRQEAIRLITERWGYDSQRGIEAPAREQEVMPGIGGQSLGDTRDTPGCEDYFTENSE